MVADAYDAVSAVPGVRTRGGGAGGPLRRRRDQRRGGRPGRVRPVLRRRGGRRAARAARRLPAQGGDGRHRPGVPAAGRGRARARTRWPRLTLGEVPPSPRAGPAAAAPRRAGAARRRRRAAAHRPGDRVAAGTRRGAAAPAPGAHHPDQHRGEHRHLPRHAAAPVRHVRTRRGGPVKAVRLHAFHTQPVIDEVPEPAISGPLDVIVKIGGAGVCRTDLHIIEGQWDAAMGTPLPYILGHENAGWVHEVGSAVTNVAVGDTVILHPTPTCGLCRACRAGDDMHCVASAFPGLSRDGGMAEYLLTSARACVKLDPQTRPQDVAALADAGITAYHAVRKAIPLLYPGTTCVRDRRGRPRPHRHPVPGRADRDQDHRGRPQPRRAQARRAARRGPHRGRRRRPGRRGQGADRRHRRRRGARLRRRAGRREGRVRDDRAGPARTTSSATAAP